MTVQASVIRSCSLPNPGDWIEVSREDQIIWRGWVGGVLPHLNLLWIMVTVTGSRQLLDLELLQVLRCFVRTVAGGRGSVHQPNPGVSWPLTPGYGEVQTVVDE